MISFDNFQNPFLAFKLYHVETQRESPFEGHPRFAPEEFVKRAILNVVASLQRVLQFTVSSIYFFCNYSSPKKDFCEESIGSIRRHFNKSTYQIPDDLKDLSPSLLNTLLASSTLFESETRQSFQSDFFKVLSQDEKKWTLFINQWKPSEIEGYETFLTKVLTTSSNHVSEMVIHRFQLPPSKAPQVYHLLREAVRLGVNVQAARKWSKQFTLNSLHPEEFQKNFLDFFLQHLNGSYHQMFFDLNQTNPNLCLEFMLSRNLYAKEKKLDKLLQAWKDHGELDCHSHLIIDSFVGGIFLPHKNIQELQRAIQNTEPLKLIPLLSSYDYTHFDSENNIRTLLETYLAGDSKKATILLRMLKQRPDLDSHAMSLRIFDLIRKKLGSEELVKIFINVYYVPPSSWGSLLGGYYLSQNFNKISFLTLQELSLCGGGWIKVARAHKESDFAILYSSLQGILSFQMNAFENEAFHEIDRGKLIHLFEIMYSQATAETQKLVFLTAAKQIAEKEWILFFKNIDLGKGVVYSQALTCLLEVKPDYFWKLLEHYVNGDTTLQNQLKIAVQITLCSKDRIKDLLIIKNPENISKKVDVLAKAFEIMSKQCSLELWNPFQRLSCFRIVLKTLSQEHSEHFVKILKPSIKRIIFGEILPKTEKHTNEIKQESAGENHCLLHLISCLDSVKEQHYLHVISRYIKVLVAFEFVPSDVTKFFIQTAHANKKKETSTTENFEKVLKILFVQITFQQQKGLQNLLKFKKKVSAQIELESKYIQAEESKARKSENSKADLIKVYKQGREKFKNISVLIESFIACIRSSECNQMSLLTEQQGNKKISPHLETVKFMKSFSDFLLDSFEKLKGHRGLIFELNQKITQIEPDLEDDEAYDLDVIVLYNAVNALKKAEDTDLQKNEVNAFLKTYNLTWRNIQNLQNVLKLRIIDDPDPIRGSMLDFHGFGIHSFKDLEEAVNLAKRMDCIDAAAPRSFQEMKRGEEVGSQ